MNNDIKIQSLKNHLDDVEAEPTLRKNPSISKPSHDLQPSSILRYFILIAATVILVYHTTSEYGLLDLERAAVEPGTESIEYSAIPGFFKQSIWGANATEIGPVPKRFGLIDGHKKYWTTFAKKIKEMNKKSGKRTQYKVLFLGRHGEGYHNLGLNYYGEEEWDRKWGRLTGNGTYTWGPDAKLTPNGINQTKHVNDLWKTEMQSGGGIPRPTALFVSPLRRALYTFNNSYAGVVDSPPLVIENLRDAYGLRTSDWRHNKTWIHERFPSFEFEEGFTETDELWKEGEREPTPHVQERVKGVLDRILALSDTYLGLVAHDKVLSATFNLTGHPDYDLPTGGVIPLVIKVTRTPA